MSAPRENGDSESADGEVALLLPSFLQVMAMVKEMLMIRDSE